jgi:hypothetical protein
VNACFSTEVKLHPLRVDFAVTYWPTSISNASSMAEWNEVEKYHTMMPELIGVEHDAETASHRLTWSMR